LKFFIDESVDAPVAERLRQDGHDLICIWELEPGLSDNDVLGRAEEDEAVLVTADKDFGELVFRMGRLHTGVILIRLAGLSLDRKCDVVSEAIINHGDEIPGSFTVITPALIRIRR
jgi:predicted nuclease of predicted toxin-antitoxin system